MTDSSYTPSSAEDFIRYFEGAGRFNPAAPFYYSPSENKMNFGFGINLTGASASTRSLIAGWLADMISADDAMIAGVPWSSLSNIPNRGTGLKLQKTLNSNVGISGDMILNYVTMVGDMAGAATGSTACM